MNYKKTSKSPGKATKNTRKIIKHVDKKRLLKTFGLLLALILIVALGLFLIQQYNSTYPTESIAGKAYSDLTAEQKQGYWACYKEKGCGVLLSEAQQNKNYATYRSCSKDCHAQALAQKQEDFYCIDSDGIDYTNKGKVTSYFYPNGKEDYCLEINGKNYLFEGRCLNNKAQWVQKNCGEMGKESECIGGQCVQVKKSEITITSSKGTATYDAYSIPNSSLRIVCQQPCVIPEEILRYKTVGAQRAITKLLNLTKIDVLDRNFPVDVHLTSDVECGDYQTEVGKYGFAYEEAGSYFPQNGSYMCLWEWEDLKFYLPLNPLYAEPKGLDAKENALRIESQVYLAHEYGHILFYLRSFASPEDFAKALNYYVSGFWDVNQLNSSFSGACDKKMNLTNVGKNVYDLCSLCGFQMADFASLLQQIDELYKSDKGKKNLFYGYDANGQQIVNKPISLSQFKEVLDNITGKDVAVDCNVDWLVD